LALRLAANGSTVTVGSRDAARAGAVVDELRARWPDRRLAIVGGDNLTAAAGDVVVVSTPWDAAAATVRPLEPQLRGKVVLSVGNALVKQGREMHALVPPRGSVAAAVQAALPTALVVAAGHHLPASDLEDLETTLEADVLVCSDNPDAARAGAAVLEGIAGLRLLDAGSLASASAVEAFTAVLVTLNMRYKAHSTLRLAGLEHVHGFTG